VRASLLERLGADVSARAHRDEEVGGAGVEKDVSVPEEGETYTVVASPVRGATVSLGDHPHHGADA